MSFVEQNPELLLDMLQFALSLCGLIPGVGEACDAVDAAISFKRGDWVGGFLSIGAAVPLFGYLASGAKGVKNADKLRSILSIVENLSKICRRSSSFITETKVVLADGSHKEIEDVQIGDNVLAGEPANRVTAARTVTATMSSFGVKALVDFTVDVDGAAGARTATITATDNHPIWVVGQDSWIAARSLAAGDKLLGPDGAAVTVEAVAIRLASAHVHNFSVSDLQTYYVAADNVAVLVHNAPPAACRYTSSPNSPQTASKTVGRTPDTIPYEWT